MYGNGVRSVSFEHSISTFFVFAMIDVFGLNFGSRTVAGGDVTGR